MKATPLPRFLNSTLSIAIMAALIAVAVILPQSAFSQGDLCAISPPPELSNSNNQLTFHLSAGQCVYFEVVDSCWCPSTPPNVCVCKVWILDSQSQNQVEFIWPCHQIAPGQNVLMHHWEYNQLKADIPLVTCWQAPSDDDYTFEAEFCARENVKIICNDCGTSPCQ